jgi:hypothetical protein
MIVSLRGTNGSGKSTVVREILARFSGEPRYDKGKVVEYFIPRLSHRGLVVIGPYLTACGGCDAIKTVDEVIQRVEHATRYGHDVLFEGILISTTYGAVGAFSEAYPDFVFAYMSTPVEECLRRVEERRAAAGNLKPFNPAGLRQKFETIARQRSKLLAAGRRVTDIVDFRDVLRLFDADILL